MKLIRQDTERVRQSIQLKREKKADLDQILELDQKRRDGLSKVEELKGLRNRESKKVGQAKKKGEDASKIISHMGEISETIKKYDVEISEINQKLNELLLWLPNIPYEDVPEGGEENNKFIRSWGEKREFDFTPKPHWDLGKDLGILNLARAAKLSGTGFSVLTGLGAQLKRALINFMLDTHLKNGYLEVAPPYIVTRSTITGSAQLPKLENDSYVTTDDSFLIPTGEVALVNYYQEETIPEEKLPILLMCASPCFRKEAGAAGKDTRGLLRVHQFHKVELVQIVRPEDSEAALEKMLEQAQGILEQLKIPYQIVKLATGDLSFASARTYDIEIWAPGVDRWLEVSSCSTCTDFQARRAKIRYKEKKQKAKFVHILNASGLALPRLIVSVMENYQQADGTIVIPEVLRPYMGGKEKITPSKAF